MYNKEQLLNQINDIFEATGNERQATWNVIDEWETRKKSKLLNLLNQELIVEKEICFSKTDDEIAEEIYAVNLPERIKNAFRKEFFNEEDNNFNPLVVSHTAKLMLHTITGGYVLAKGKIDRDYILEKPLPGVKQTKFQKGTKISRILRLLIDDKEELEKILVEYSRFFNQAKLKGTLCISIHPIDYLTASLNKCNWRSCFNLETGEWKSSLGGLMASPYTMIAYLKAKDDMDHNGFVWNNKRWRTYITINDGLDINYFHIGKHYPYCNEELENELVNMMNDLLDGEFKLHNASYNFYTQADEDGFYDDGVENVYVREGLVELENCNIPVAEEVMCLCCGDIYTNNDSNTIYCDECYPSYYTCCYECGEYITHNDIDNGYYYYAEDTDRYFCSYCGENKVNYCEHCGYDLENTSVHEVQIEGKTYSENWCEDCIDGSNHTYSEEKEIFIIKE